MSGSGSRTSVFGNPDIADPQLARLVCPIGLPGLSGKEPAAIALSAAAQLMQLAAAAETGAAKRASRR